LAGKTLGNGAPVKTALYLGKDVLPRANVDLCFGVHLVIPYSCFHFFHAQFSPEAFEVVFGSASV
jgi:hypothetical protein